MCVFRAISNSVFKALEESLHHFSLLRFEVESLLLATARGSMRTLHQLLICRDGLWDLAPNRHVFLSSYIEPQHKALKT